MFKKIKDSIKKFSLLITSILTFFLTIAIEKIFERQIDELISYIFDDDGDVYYQVDADFNILYFGDKGVISVKKNGDKPLESEQCIIRYIGKLILGNNTNSCNDILISIPQKPWKNINDSYVNMDSNLDEIIYIKIMKSDNLITEINYRIPFLPVISGIDLTFEGKLEFNKKIKYKITLKGESPPDWMKCNIITPTVSNYFLPEIKSGCRGIFFAKEDYLLNKTSNDLTTSVGVFMDDAGRIGLINKNFLVSSP